MTTTNDHHLDQLKPDVEREGDGWRGLARCETAFVWATAVRIFFIPIFFVSTDRLFIPRFRVRTMTSSCHYAPTAGRRSGLETQHILSPGGYFFFFYYYLYFTQANDYLQLDYAYKGQHGLTRRVSAPGSSHSRSEGQGFEMRQ
jgi:hypothetical protein